METEDKTPDALEGSPAAETPNESPSTESVETAELDSPSPQDESGEDTGETPEVQAEAVTEPTTTDAADNPIQAAAASPKEVLPEWIQQIARYHDAMNGLLAGKENLKIMSVNKSVRPSFYKKWVFESNQLMRLTVNLRHRQARALERLRAAKAQESESAPVEVPVKDAS